MIHYSIGAWGVAFIFQRHGSVFPKAFCWALPNAIIGALLHYLVHPKDYAVPHEMGGVNYIFASGSGALAFLVVFRSNQAYGRFQEGAALISQVRGSWFNAVSNLIAFCSTDPTKQGEVLKFQHLLVRLSSMLYCAALQQVCDLRDDTMEIIDPMGMSPESLAYLQDVNNRCEILLQWMQHLIVDVGRTSVLDISPPILSRVFQELSNGMVDLNHVRNICDIPFPFPYAQLLTCVLVLQFFFIPIFAAFFIHSRTWAALACFSYTGLYACLMYIPNEMDQPFGSDANDLPVADMQREYNKSLLNLLNPLAQRTPSYEYDKDRETSIVESGFGLRSSPRAKSSLRSSVTLSQILTRASSKESSRASSKESSDSTPCPFESEESSPHGSPKGKKRLPTPQAVRVSRASGVGCNSIEEASQQVTCEQEYSKRLLCQLQQSSTSGEALGHGCMGPHASSTLHGEWFADLEREAGQHVIPMYYNCPIPLMTPRRPRSHPLDLQPCPCSIPHDLSQAIGPSQQLPEKTGPLGHGYMGPHASSELDGEWFVDLEREAGKDVIPMYYNFPPTLMTPRDPNTPRLALQAHPQITPRDLYSATSNCSNTHDDPPQKMLPSSEK